MGFDPLLGMSRWAGLLFEGVVRGQQTAALLGGTFGRSEVRSCGSRAEPMAVNRPGVFTASAGACSISSVGYSASLSMHSYVPNPVG